MTWHILDMLATDLKRRRVKTDVPCNEFHIAVILRGEAKTL